MNKIEYINALAERLQSLPPAEVNKITSYYSELVEDMIEDGLSEEAAVASLGDIESVAREAVQDVPLQTLVRARMAQSKSGGVNTGLFITVLVLTSFVWAPVLFGLLAAAFGIFAAIIAVIVSIYVSLIAFGVSGIAAMISGTVLLTMGSPAAGIFTFGSGMLLIGLTLLLIKPVVLLSKALVKFTVYVFRQIKTLFISRKRQVNDNV